MNKKLTCNQVSALINFYIEGKLNSRLKEYFELHLKVCPRCKEKVTQLKKILSRFSPNIVQKVKSESNKAEYKIFRQLCAYLDNELNTQENIRVKKMTISNPKARQELEKLYKFQKALQGAYQKTKNEIKYDYSKNVLSKVEDGYDYTTNYFYKLATLFALLLIAIIAGFIYLYF